MTRKQAILQAIEILSQNKENKGIVLKLKEIESELPVPVWTKESIIDAIETYASEHNNTLPQVTDLTNENNLPSNTVIYHKFGISSMDVFLKEYFPHLNPQNKSSSPYRFEDDGYFLNIFKENYERIKNETQEKYVNSKQYNKYRKENTPQIYTIIKKCGCKSYEDLLILCGYKKEKKPLEAVVDISYQDEEKHNIDLVEILNNITNIDRKK